MFQTYEPRTDRTFAAQHLPRIRAEMERLKLDGFIVPHDDEYHNEYTPACADRLAWASGFTGSAGAAIIFRDRAVIFVDGRYTLQVRDQVDGDWFDYEDLSATPPEIWLATHGVKGSVIGYDPMLHTRGGVAELETAAKKRGFTLVCIADNPIDAAWGAERPAAPSAKVDPYPADLAGETSKAKRERIAKAVAEAGADAVVLTAPHSLAWLLNIRGGDVAHTPVPLGRTILHADGRATLFVAPEKVTNDLPAHLGDDVDIRAEDSVGEALDALGHAKQRVLLDPGLAPAWFFDRLSEAGATIVEGADPCALPRACKNGAELSGARAAHIRDGAAVTRFLHWLATARPADLDEIGAAKKLESFRAETGKLKDLSFESISGSASNGAVVHYRVTTKTAKKLPENGLYLIDSGGQYQDGTTDITRTVGIGTPTAEMRDRFTRVLKGHIALATLRFPEGTTGHAIDALARRPLWEAGLDYDHGTGHGVGVYLGVHEGPQRIAKAINTQPLKAGMIVSNEPGYYKTGEFGIRIENLIIVLPAEPIAGGERAMHAFETITLAPLDRNLIETNILSADERDWVDAYHARVKAVLTPHVPQDVAAWLDEATKPL